MPDVDFVMTYPCYFLLTESGQFTTIVIGGNQCVCLFTDGDLVNNFYRAKFGPSDADRKCQVVECLEYDGLISALEDHEHEFAVHGVLNLAIDPTPGKMTAYIPIREFIEQLHKPAE